MRIAMVCPYSLSRPGGVQGQVKGLARALRALGHDVAVLAPDDAHQTGLVARPPSVPGESGLRWGGTYSVGRSLSLRSNGSVAPVSLSPMSAIRTQRFVGREGVDVVHLHEPLAPLVGYGSLIGSTVPVVGTYHRSGDSRAYQLLGPLARWANGRLAVRCAVSEAAAETARSAMGGTYEVLFNGIEVDRFAGARPWPTDRPTVLFLGRHEERKGLGVLLEGFERVSDPAVLWIAGDGPETERLRRAHPESERVHWLGMVDEEEVASRLAGADVLCAPSLGGESFGMVLLEGMAAGCAVVASDIPGYRAAAGGHAALVPSGDPVALAGALAEALDGRAQDDGAALAARRGGLAHAEEWSMARLADRYAEIYARVTADP